MFGKIINVEKSKIIVENKSGMVPLQYIGIHIVFEEEKRKIIGKITNITKEIFECLLLGEIVGEEFIPGIYKAPVLKNLPRIVTAQELELLIGYQDYTRNDTFLLGSSTIYDRFKVTANLNKFFSNHFAIIGNSGFGKSCGAARILQNIFYYNQTNPIHSHIVLFDVYGEYQSALTKINDLPGINVKLLNTGSATEMENQISIPPYFLDADDLTLLLNVKDSSLIPTLEKAIQFANIFKSDDPNISAYKNEIISTCLLETLSSGKNSSQIRDQIISILNKYNTPELNLNSEIKEPGYTRTIKQCLNIDNQGKMNAIGLVIDFLTQFQNANAQSKIELTTSSYTLEDLYDALEFALLSEGVYNNVSMYEKASFLKVQLHQLMNGPYKHFFSYSKTISRKEFVESFFRTNRGEEAQIVDINLTLIDDRFTKTLTKLYSRMFFQYGTTHPNRASYPIHIILEEAHRYVNNDNDLEVLGYNIFDRITKEGRKYGVLMGFITQRPSELSETALSQCSNFLVFRIFHPDDFKIIDSITSSISRDEIDELKTLRAGMALAFGNALALPALIQLDMPDPRPESSNVNIKEVWF